MIQQTKIPNLDIVGIMVRDRISTTDPDVGLDCPCVWCEGMLFEAWERMTYGGCWNEDGPGVYKTVDYGRSPYVAAR